MGKKMSKLDRAEALIRIPEYQKDLKRLSQIRKKLNLYHFLRKERDIFDKYGLITLITPELVKEMKNPSNKIIKAKIEQAKLFKTKPWITSIEVDLNLPIKESKFLAWKDIEVLYDAVKEFREKPKERNKKFANVYPWDIYDMYHNENKSFTKIAKEISGINKNPAYDTRVMGVYKSVKRAYEHAARTIEQVKAEIEINRKNNLSSPLPNKIQKIVRSVRAHLKRISRIPV